MKTEVVYLKVRLELTHPINEDEVQELIENLDYSFTDEKNRIQDTEISEFEINEDEDQFFA